MGKKSLDSLRTAPLGWLSFGANAAFVMGEAYSFIRTPENYEMLFFIPVNAMGLAMSGLLIANQFRLKKRLEETIARNGYSDRVFSTTTDEWCARQTTNVVCKNSGHLDEYRMLCRRQKKTAKLSWLPHL